MWVTAVSNALGPWYQILGFLLTVAGLIVYFRKFLKKWLERLEGQQVETQQIARDAADSAGHAATQSRHALTAANTAGAHALTATETSMDTNKAMEWLVRELVEKDDALAESLIAREYLKERVDTAVALIAYQAAERPVTRPNVPDPGHTEPDEEDDDDPAMVTGRHRLPKRMIHTQEQDTH